MVNGLTGMDALRGAATWNGPNVSKEALQATSDAARFEDALKRATQSLQDAKASVEASGIDAEAEAKRLREACQGFEAMFLDIVFKSMRNTVPENTLFGESNGEKIWHSMLDSELMQNVAKSGGVGVADMMYDNLIDQVTAQTLAAKGKTNHP